MVRKIFKFFSVIVIVIGASACQTFGGYNQYGYGAGPNQVGGTLIGAGLGALAGSQIGSGRGQLAAVAIGTLAGANIGGNVGASMDVQQQMLYRYPTQRVIIVPQVGYVGGYGFIGYAQCEAYGAGSQARADCIRANADNAARRDEVQTQIQGLYRN